MTSRSPIIALIVAAGLAALGFFIGDGIRDSRKLTRSVDVRGLAERDVVADTAHLSINLGLSGNDRTRLFTDLQKVQRTVIQQLKANGIKDAEIAETQWSTSEISAEEYKDDPERPRYTLTGGVEIATPNIEAIKKINFGI
ncbi:MAG: SIMPL domain-containing protein, partial [Candidatus Competibacteraceae bacterium]|nr:SIMPL domain-containing protein [Candidatus Competibacteraceae bacterium]